ncbi:glycerophosphodiester phosphodiesterase [Ahniella affigens]|uniref:glycerophosphodiester phosphodiesterase n=1 Tax=Ahniella affigens TaxID=2021234 RepID=A0A2P1PQI0_9GAMM|nr:glycerophosphodiester phosphodiesterase family protein [Ahniella affigens]AVP97107.1 glycerophosphodiester phosphodiesterase [Ahniella affigens]
MIWNTLDGQPTRIIAHRGASGYLPEHALAAYDLGVQIGADVIEPDLVMTRDHQLLVRHDAGLDRSTDIATHVPFANRKRVGLDGHIDWWTSDFARAELRVLRPRQPFATRAQTFPESVILDFQETLQWFLMARESRPFALYPELKHPEWFAEQRLDVVSQCVRDLQAVGLQGRASPVWIQCFKLAPLRLMREQTDNPVFALFDSAQIGDAAWLTDTLHRHPYLDGVALPKSAWFGHAGASLVDVAHAAGRQAHAWTIRDDQVGAGFASSAAELERLFALGVDAIFCDFPDTALVARQRFGATPDKPSRSP